jgi:hypothetical protein
VILLLGGSDVSVAILFEAPSPVPFSADLRMFTSNEAPAYVPLRFPPDVKRVECTRHASLGHDCATDFCNT